MPNGTTTFKFRGRTYGLEALFSASEARAEKYSAFGREKTFLGKLLGLGFVVTGDVVYHPDHWEPLASIQTGFYSHRFITDRGNVRLGRIEAIKR
jgi:hypothetical protein